MPLYKKKGKNYYKITTTSLFIGLTYTFY